MPGRKSEMSKMISSWDSWAWRICSTKARSTSAEERPACPGVPERPEAKSAGLLLAMQKVRA